MRKAKANITSTPKSLRTHTHTHIRLKLSFKGSESSRFYLKLLNSVELKKMTTTLGGEVLGKCCHLPKLDLCYCLKMGLLWCVHACKLLARKCIFIQAILAKSYLGSLPICLKTETGMIYSKGSNCSRKMKFKVFSEKTASVLELRGDSFHPGDTK